MSTTVFISSTSRDLLDHRAAVAKALLKAGYHPIDMADFVARPQGATTACLKEVAESDLFVGIYAWRYGYIPQGAAASITEQEYIEAERLGKPCFIFMVDETYTWSEAFKESGQSAQLLQDFKNRLDLKLVRTLFTSADDLAMKVLASLQRYERDHRPQEQAARSAAESLLRADTQATPVAPAQPSRQTSIGGVNFSGISGGSISIGGNISSNVTAGGDIVAGDKIGGPAVAADSPQGQLVSALAQWQKEIEAKINA